MRGSAVILKIVTGGMLLLICIVSIRTVYRRLQSEDPPLHNPVRFRHSACWIWCEDPVMILYINLWNASRPIKMLDRK